MQEEKTTMQDNIKRNEAKEFLDKIKQILGSRLEDDAFAEQLKKWQDFVSGLPTNWKSTEYPRQVLKMKLRLEIPESLSIKDLLNEIKKAEEKLNHKSEIKYKIEFGD